MTRIITAIYGPLMFVAGLYAGWRMFAYSPATHLMLDSKYIATACNEDFLAAWQVIKEKHVGAPVSDEQLKQGAIAGMTESLKDQYSSFLNPQEAKLQKQVFSGKFYGIGAVVTKKEHGLIFESVLPDSPAAKSGLLPEDELVAINGQSVSENTPLEAIRQIRGDEGTVVKLTVIRESVDRPLEITVTRGEIKDSSVKTEMISSGEKTFMHITVSSFHDDTDALFSGAARRAIGEGVDGVILDLRNDGGGLVDEAVKLACRWRTDSPIVYLRRRNGEREPMTCPKDANSLFSDMPTVVLVNKNTASAAEILTGALQDFGLAHVIGEKTFGKGCGQDVFTFKDGSQMCLVTFLWETPNGRSIHNTGLTPEEVLQADPKEIAAGKDVQMQRAVQYLHDGR